MCGVLCLTSSGKTESSVDDEAQEATQPLVVIDERYDFFTDFYSMSAIACCAECCISHDRFRLSVTVWYHVKMTRATIMRSSLEDSPMTLVSS